MPRFKKSDRARADAELHPARLPPQGRAPAPGGRHRADAWCGRARCRPPRPRSGSTGTRLGHWYASFVVATEAEPFPEHRAGDRHRLGREGDRHHHLRRPRPAARAAREEGRRKLTRYQRMMARRKPAKGQAASKGYREAKRRRPRPTRRSPAQRQDTGRKWAKKVVSDHDEIAVEDFRPKFLAKTTMARKAADAAIGATKRALIEMAPQARPGRAPGAPRAHHHGLRACGARTKHACRCPNEPTPAPRAAPSCRGTRTPPP